MLAFKRVVGTNTINSAMVNFFWDYKGDKQRMHFLNSICFLFLPKKLGGLDLRDSRLVNKALLTKQSWRIIDNSKATVSKWVNNKYLVKHSNFEIKSSTQSLIPWKSIVHNSNMITDHLQWKLGNGARIDIKSRFLEFFFFKGLQLGSKLLMLSTLILFPGTRTFPQGFARKRRAIILLTFIHLLEGGKTPSYRQKLFLSHILQQLVIQFCTNGTIKNQAIELLLIFYGRTSEGLMYHFEYSSLSRKCGVMLFERSQI